MARPPEVGQGGGRVAPDPPGVSQTKSSQNFKMFFFFCPPLFPSPHKLSPSHVAFYFRGSPECQGGGALQEHQKNEAMFEVLDKKVRSSPRSRCCKACDGGGGVGERGGGSRAGMEPPTDSVIVATSGALANLPWLDLLRRIVVDDNDERSLQRMRNV